MHIITFESWLQVSCSLQATSRKKITHITFRAWWKRPNGDASGLHSRKPAGVMSSLMTSEMAVNFAVTLYFPILSNSFHSIRKNISWKTQSCSFKKEASAAVADPCLSFKYNFRHQKYFSVILFHSRSVIQVKFSQKKYCKLSWSQDWNEYVFYSKL